MTNMPTSTVTAILGAVLLALLIAAVTLLTWNGNIEGTQAMGFFSGLTLAGVIGGVQHVGTQSGAKAAKNQ